MFSRFRIASHLSRSVQLLSKNDCCQKSMQNVVSKRWSGHNNMEIKPTVSDWILTKNWAHFYAMLGLIPVTIMTTIINIRANPELSEVPDGYEPRYWEYYKHPITRWLARVWYDSMESDHETMMGYQEMMAEKKIIAAIIEKADRVMNFYHDHRSMYFEPNFAEYIRIGREDSLYIIPFMKSDPNRPLDRAYDPDIAVIPVEGYLHGPVSRN